MNRNLTVAYMRHFPCRDEKSRQHYEQLRNSSPWMKKAIAALEDIIYSQSNDPVHAVIHFHAQLDDLKTQLMVSLNTATDKPLHGRWMDLLLILHEQSEPYECNEDFYYRFRTPETLALAITSEISMHWQVDEESDEYQTGLDTVIEDWSMLLSYRKNANQHLLLFINRLHNALSA